jgi:thioredoxin reductase
MTNESKHQVKEEIDIAILGGGPAGLQAALVLSRTRKKIVVFDTPEPPRNAASHGVHNFLGLDGLLPKDIRKIAWEQIDKYNSAELRKEKIVNVNKEEKDGIFVITMDNENSIRAKKVILAVGYYDSYPDIPGFVECWTDTIISCPFCDGYENRDRIWGIVANSKMQLISFPKMVQNLTSKIKVFLSPNIKIEPSYQIELSKLDISVYRGIITKVNHSSTKVESVSLESSENIQVDTLLWIPQVKPIQLIQRLIENFGLELNEQGYIKTYEELQTNVKGLYAAGGVQGWSPIGALAAAYNGGIAATSIVREWYD